MDRGASGENGLAAAALSRTAIRTDGIRDGTDIGRNRGIFRRQFVDIAEFDVNRRTPSFSLDDASADTKQAI
jgi:hypothetical protein